MKPITVENPSFNTNVTFDLEAVWSNINFQVVDKEFEFINLLKENLGGDLVFKGFLFEENEVFDWYCSRGRLDEINFNQYFLLSEKVLSQFRTLVHNSDGSEELVKSWKIDKSPKLEWVNEFCIDGELSSLLYHGGAYGSKFKRPTKEIKEIAQKFCFELFEEDYRYQSVRCYNSNTAWNSWFIDFIIDQTILIICMKSRTLWLLAHTDQD